MFKPLEYWRGERVIYNNKTKDATGMLCLAVSMHLPQANTVASEQGFRMSLHYRRLFRRLSRPGNAAQRSRHASAKPIPLRLLKTKVKRRQSRSVCLSDASEIVADEFSTGRRGSELGDADPARETHTYRGYEPYGIALLCFGCFPSSWIVCSHVHPAVLRAPSSLSFVPMYGAPGLESANAFDSDALTAGVLRIPPKGQTERTVAERPRVYVVQAGRVDMSVGAAEFAAGKSALVHVPARMAFQLRNTSSEHARLAFVTLK